ncbi:MAG: winged helix-turn-helix domain-containing protein [Oscillospiraceae bacterium]|jgi:two-component system alkaline phosphatase synthesis response regulator PhoP
MIYCVEDDDSIRELMVYTLKASGYEAQGFSKAEDFWTAVQKEKPQLVLLDIMLPDEDGMSILKKLRANQATRNIPVILATAKGNEYDKVLGLDSGADDYLAKPFGMMEMVSRIRAVLRRTSPQGDSDIISVGDVTIDAVKHRVTCCGKPVELTLKEFEILRLLASNPETVFTREMLLENVWSIDYVGETRTVDVHMATLRSKMGPCGGMIKTIRGVGYKLEDKK